MSADSFQKRAALAAVVLCGVFYFAFLGARALWDPGEGRYALISREMVQSGDWLIPRLNGALYFEKPPLAYWLNAAAMRVLGFSEIAARFFTALAGFLSVLLAYFFAKRLYGGRTAALACAILACSAGFFAWSQIPELDMLFTLFLCSGMCLIYAAFENMCANRALWAHAGYALLGLACLVKGPAAFALPLIVFVPYLLLTDGWRRLRELYPVTGILLAVAVCAPWFIAISAKEPEFFKFFFIRENFQRYSSTMHGRRGQMWYFIPVVIAMMYPWCCALPAVLASAFKAARRGADRHGLFLLLWFAMIFAFFSLSGSKRPPYMLPVLIPLAILAARHFSLKWEEGGLLGAFAAPYAALNVLLVAGLIIVPHYISYLDPGSGINWIAPAAALAWGASLALWFASRNSAAGVYAAVAAAQFAFLGIMYFQASGFDKTLSRKAMAQMVMSEFRPGDKIAAFNADYERNLQSFGYYSGQRVRVIGDQGELQFGAGLDPHRDQFFPDYGTLRKWVRSKDRVFIITKRDRLPELDFLGKPLYGGKILPGKLVVLSNRPWGAGK